MPDHSLTGMRPNILPGASVGEHLTAVRARYPGSDPEMVADVVRAVLATMSGDLAAQGTSLLAEVEELGRTIAAAKCEIAALRMDEITESHIPFATDELDAIVEHTASATNIILASCETLDALADRADAEHAAKLQDVTTRIYEACSFQDITGQRISKVVSTLKAIEEKVASILATFGRSVNKADSRIDPTAEEDALLNGPQLPAAAMGQSDIDRLLASFD